MSGHESLKSTNVNRYYNLCHSYSLSRDFRLFRTIFYLSFSASSRSSSISSFKRCSYSSTATTQSKLFVVNIMLFIYVCVLFVCLFFVCFVCFFFVLFFVCFVCLFVLRSSVCCLFSPIIIPYVYWFLETRQMVCITCADRLANLLSSTKGNAWLSNVMDDLNRVIWIFGRDVPKRREDVAEY